jgi:hypothetical protein
MTSTGRVHPARAVEPLLPTRDIGLSASGLVEIKQGGVAIVDTPQYGFQIGYA